MTPHLSPQEYVDAADGALAEARHHHLDLCASCREQIVALRQLMSAVEVATDVPEPSPLFWDHFSQRVRTATATPAPATGWWQAWRPLSLGALLAVAVMLIAVHVRQGPGPASLAREARLEVAASDVSTAGEVSLADDDSWEMMVMMASNLSTDDLHRLAAPMTGVADTMGTDLTLAEQKELVRLIRREMGGAE